MIFRIHLIRHSTTWLSSMLLLCCSLFSGQLQANPDQALMQQIKTAFVFNIAKFVHWPDNAGRHSMLLCHYRANALGNGFKSISGKTIHGQPVVEKLIRRLEDAKDCSILFIPRDQLELFNAEQWHVAEDYTLTIADLTSLSEQDNYSSSAIISLIRQGSRVGLEVNLKEVQKTPLQISSELLKLARVRR